MKRIIAFSTFLLCGFAALFACTGISITTEDKSIIQARSIEWGGNSLDSKLAIYPAGIEITAKMPDGNQGYQWKTKYGFVGITTTIDTVIGEGLNEKGLNAGVFFFKDYGSLAPYNKELNSISITDMDIVRWALSTCSTVDEVIENIQELNIVPIIIDAQGNYSPTGHWRIADKTGKNIVIEIINEGEMHIYENIGVITNSPGYDWHITNLNNYINMNPGTNKNKEFGPLELKAFGDGSASFGLPGDVTSPSRFVRAAFYLFNRADVKTAKEGTQQAFHILNNFDIPVGSRFSEADRKKIPDISSSTQWTAVSDLTNGLYYFKTMYNSEITCIDVAKIVKQVKKLTYNPIDDGSFTFSMFKMK